jgi:hypothetical protein
MLEGIHCIIWARALGTHALKMSDYKKVPKTYETIIQHHTLENGCGRGSQLTEYLIDDQLGEFFKFKVYVE